MNSKDKMLDDVARLAGGTASLLSGLQHNIREDIKARIDETALRLDLVPRDDFDRLMLRVEALEQKLAELEKTNTKSSKGQK